MDKYKEQFKSGWLLMLVRSIPSAWMLIPATIDQSNMGLDVLCSHAIKFSDARCLLKDARQIKHSDNINELGLPMVSVYTHKYFGVSEYGCN